MKRFLTALALASALSVSTLAGDIPTSGSPAPPPPGGTTQAKSSTAPGEVPTVGSAVSSTALSALLTVLGLLA